MLDRVRIAVRPRSSWEAMDLGLALLRDQAGPVARVWAVLALPLLAVLALACHRSPWWAPLLFWWLKPALDRPVLHVLAKATFGPAPGWRETFRAAPGYARRGLAATLLWRRLGAARGLLLPVWQLEEAGGPAYRRRRRILLARGREAARLLAAVGLLATGLLVLAAVTGIGYFAPGPAGWNLLPALFGGPGNRLPWLDALLPVLAMAAMAAVEPFFVAAGYGLYLNRRVQLEGWDLELAFRDLARRILDRARPGAALVLAALLALGAGPRPASAQAPAPAPAAQPEPKAVLAEVLQAPEFASRRQGWHLRPRRPARAQAPRSLPGWVPALAVLLARGLRWLLPVALVLALAYVAWRHRGTLALALARPDPAPPAPGRLFGLDLRPGALPPDLAGAALALWDQGDPRAALALLYRGALAHLAHDRRAPVGAAATEAECLFLAGRHLPEPAAAYFARLLEAWRATAYGGLAPAAGARDLCAAWAVHFAAPKARP
jgi:hypothetical protein